MTASAAEYPICDGLGFVPQKVGRRPAVATYSWPCQDFGMPKLVVISASAYTKYCVSRKFCENPFGLGRPRVERVTGL